MSLAIDSKTPALKEILKTLEIQGNEAFFITKFHTDELKPNEIKADIWNAVSLHNDRKIGLVDIFQAGSSWGLTNDQVSAYIDLSSSIVDTEGEPVKFIDSDGYCTILKPNYLLKPAIIFFKLPGDDSGNLLIPINSLTYWQYAMEGLARINTIVPENHQDRAAMIELYYDYLDNLEQFYILPPGESIKEDNLISRYTTAFWFSHTKKYVNLANTCGSVN